MENIKSKTKYSFFQYVWIFIAGCYLGYAVETLWCLIKNGFINRTPRGRVVTELACHHLGLKMP